jgi:KDO2-lipid IV(A) lauroyltransferase
LRNLELCFPERDAASRERLARAHFKAWARAFLDRGLLWFASPERLRRLIRVEGLEHLEAAMPTATGRPLIIVVPHFVGLDAGGVDYSMRHRGVSMYAEQSDLALDARLRAGRARFNQPVLVTRSEGIRPVVRAMKAGLPYFVLPDMDLGAADAVFVDFFGTPAATVTVVPKLARMTKANVIALITTFADDGHGYVARYYPMWPEYRDGLLPGEIEATRRMNAFIEDRVREAPEQYYWVHRRFKTRPAGAPRIY